MPEIGEVARIVHYLHKHLVGRTLAVVKAQHDENVFGKVGTSAAEFEKALTGKRVVDAKQQGKYFWLVMSAPPHPLFHFGMAGWWKIRDLETAYYKPSKPEEAVWPPKYCKFTLETSEEPKSEHAFVDLRRFGRIRLVDCPGDGMRNVSPLKENGPDPVIDKEILTEEWLVQKLQSKHVPIKALLLDQANISGIGNWVGDELLYDAKIHPEQYSNTLSPGQMKQLHRSIHYVCSTAVELLAESDRFPKEWLFKHRWAKGKKDAPQRLPNGEKIKFVTVGGRTSAIIPSVQKKTGEVAADVKGQDSDENENEDEDEDEDERKPNPAKRKAKKIEDGNEDRPKPKLGKYQAKQDDGEVEHMATAKPTRRKIKTGKKDDEGEEAVTDIKTATPLKGKDRVVKEEGLEGTDTEVQAHVNGNTNNKSLPCREEPRKQNAAKLSVQKEETEASSGRRRSTRVAGATK
ncbi:MAG: hypothetical protein Q9182_005883 [Xanthomendoza sp. 2 TL-2023]